MPTLACLNGEIMPVEEAKVPVWDRGFLFGDSVYEVFRLFRGRLWLEAEHRARLARSLGEMEFPPVDLETLMDRVRRTIAASEVDDGTAYIQITRGVAPRSHPFPDPPVPPTELIIVRPYDDAATAGAPRDGRARRQPARPTLGTLRRQVDEPARQRHGARTREAGRGLRGRARRPRWVRHRGDAFVDLVGPLRPARRDARRPRPSSPGQSGISSRRSPRRPHPVRRGADLARRSGRCDEVLLLGTTIEVLPVIAIDGRPVGIGEARGRSAMDCRRRIGER